MYPFNEAAPNWIPIFKGHNVSVNRIPKINMTFQDMFTAMQMNMLVTVTSSEFMPTPTMAILTSQM